MSKLTDTLSAVLSKLAEWLGMKSDDSKKLSKFEEALTRARAQNEDQIEAAKDDIRRLENRFKSLNKDYEAARGDIKKMIAKQLEGVARELDRFEQTAAILSSKAEQYAIGLAKIRDGRLLLDQGKAIPADLFDEVAEIFREAAAEMKLADAGARQLDNERYESPERAKVDVSQRVGELEGAKETATELSDSTLKRLKELEEG